MEEQQDIITRMNERYIKMSKGHKAVAAYISDHYEQRQSWEKPSGSVNPQW